MRGTKERKGEQEEKEKGTISNPKLASITNKIISATLAKSIIPERSLGHSKKLTLFFLPILKFNKRKD